MASTISRSAVGNSSLAYADNNISKSLHHHVSPPLGPYCLRNSWAASATAYALHPRKFLKFEQSPDIKSLNKVQYHADSLFFRAP